MRSIARAGGARRLVVALLLCLAALASILPVAAQRPNGAGIVIRFGNGSILYAYVQFEEETISSEELLYRSGLAVTIAPYSGLGAGVCSINGEGCPSDNCFCQSYTTPAYFWHFYANDGGWQELLQGPSSRSVGDGDIDGWSWTAGEAGLPAVSIDDIASINGVDRNAPELPPTEEPTSTPPPVPTDTPAPTATEPVPTIVPFTTPTATASEVPTTLATAPQTETPTANPTQSNSTGQAATSPSPTLPPVPSATPTASPTRTREATANAPAPTLTLVASVTTVAVLVQPDGTAVPVEVIQADDGFSATTLMLFGGLVAIATGAGAFVWVRGRRAA